MTYDPKAYMKEYNQRPEVKVRKGKYNQCPKAKKYSREYCRRPEVKERRKAYYQAHKEKYDTASRNWAANHKEKVNAYARAYRESHPEYDPIRDARQNFKELASINPEKAKEIVSEIESQEGPRFLELILDGIPEKLKINGGD